MNHDAVSTPESPEVPRDSRIRPIAMRDEGDDAPRWPDAQRRGLLRAIADESGAAIATLEARGVVVPGELHRLRGRCLFALDLVEAADPTRLDEESALDLWSEMFLVGCIGLALPVMPARIEVTGTRREARALVRSATAALRGCGDLVSAYDTPGGMALRVRCAEVTPLVTALPELVTRARLLGLHATARMRDGWAVLTLAREVA